MHLEPFLLSFLHVLVIVGVVDGGRHAAALWFGAMVEVVIGGGR